MSARTPFDFKARWPGGSDAQWRVATYNLAFASSRVTATFDCLENPSFYLLVPGKALRPIRCVVSGARLRLAVALDEATPELALGGVDRLRARMRATTVESKIDGGTLVAHGAEHQLGERVATMIESRDKADVGLSLTAHDGTSSADLVLDGPRIASATIDGEEMVPTMLTRHETLLGVLAGFVLSVLLWWFEVPRRLRRR